MQPYIIIDYQYLFNLLGEDIWRYVGKLTDAQKSMLDDRFKWKVRYTFLPFLLDFKLKFVLFGTVIYACFHPFIMMTCQVREMEKRKEGKPGEARAALRRSVREIGYVISICCSCILHLC